MPGFRIFWASSCAYDDLPFLQPPEINIFTGPSPARDKGTVLLSHPDNRTVPFSALFLPFNLVKPSLFGILIIIAHFIGELPQLLFLLVGELGRNVYNQLNY